MTEGSSEVGMAALRVGAVVYPQSVLDRDMSQRSPLPFAWNEPLMVQYARPLFEGHDQPRCYAIDPGGRVTVWDDSLPEHVEMQVELARGRLDYFLFDMYVGAVGESVVHELSRRPIRNFVSAMGGIEYALMAVLERPRVSLPFAGADAAPAGGRSYALNAATARGIVEEAAEHWSRGNYLRYRGRPCLWLFPNPDQVADDGLARFVAQLRDHSRLATREEPYLVGVLRRRQQAIQLSQAGVDALTGYAFLPAFGGKADAIQSYADRLGVVENEWHAISRSVDVPWLPPAVVGWDASPRGCPWATWPRILRDRTYPYVPIIYDATPESFGLMLDRCARFLGEHAAPPFLTVTAWNEIGEGCALLPRVHADGRVDDAYLAELRSFRRRRRLVPPPLAPVLP